MGVSNWQIKLNTQTLISERIVPARRSNLIPNWIILWYQNGITPKCKIWEIKINFFHQSHAKMQEMRYQTFFNLQEGKNWDCRQPYYFERLHEVWNLQKPTVCHIPKCELRAIKESTNHFRLEEGERRTSSKFVDLRIRIAHGYLLEQKDTM